MGNEQHIRKRRRLVKRIVGNDRARLMSKIDRSGGPDACWPFTGGRTGHGYGNFYLGGKYLGAHKATWLLMVGAIPDGLEVDHTCHNADKGCAGGHGCLHRRCLNWERHLRLATHLDNDLAGRTGHRTRCPKGHEYTSDNTYVWTPPNSDGERWFCRTCHAAKEEKRKIRRREAC